MRKQKRTLIMRNGKKRVVEGLIFGGLIVHDGNEIDYLGDRWRISHIQSGICIQKFSNYINAVDCAKKLSRVGSLRILNKVHPILREYALKDEK